MSEMQNNQWPGWETVKLIGRGSFGAVYEIERKVFDETEKAALKVISIPQDYNDIEEMRSDGYNEDSITETFKEHLKSIVAEYSLMRKIGDCKNIVKCDDMRYVQHDDGIGWDIFIRMELLTPLTKYLPNVIPESLVIKLAKDICAALAECKKYDIIHRDIKPQNVFVSENGDFKLGDFGIAKFSEKTSVGTKIGTYKYMAPEVYNNQPYGTSADIYSLGLVLYWMLNERRMPFLPRGEARITTSMEAQARSRRFAGEPLPPPTNGSTPLKAVVLKACAYNPTNRYNSPHEMLAALHSITSTNTNAELPGQSAPTGRVESENTCSAADLDVNLVTCVAAHLANSGYIQDFEIPEIGMLRVKIPAGTQDGAVLRVPGVGKKNPATGAQGDVFITVMHTAGQQPADGIPKESGGTDNSPYEMLAALHSVTSTNANAELPGQSAPAGRVESENTCSAADLDVNLVTCVAAHLANSGYIQDFEIPEIGMLRVKIPAGTQDGAVLRVPGVGKKNPATGAQGDVFITVMHTADRQPADGIPKESGGTDNTTDKDAGSSAVISSKEAKNGCKKTFEFKNGSSVSVQIPAGCQNGQVIDGIQIYVHDFSMRSDLTALPEAVLTMYANKSSGLWKGILWSSGAWLTLGGITAQYDIMSVGLVASVVFFVIRGIKRKNVINKAKEILQSRQAKIN